MHLECLRCILFPQPGFILLAPNWKRSNACCFSAGLQTSNQRWLILSYPTYPIDTQSQNKPLDFLSVTIADSEGSVHTMSTLQKHWYMNPLSPSWPQILANKALNTTLFCQCWWLVLVPFSGLRQAQDTDRSGIQASRHPQLQIHNNPPNSEMTHGTCSIPWWTCRLNVKYEFWLDMTWQLLPLRAHLIPKAFTVNLKYFKCCDSYSI